MMEFNEFTTHIRDHIREYLPEECRNASVNLCTVNKNNGQSRCGLTIRVGDDNVSPNLYLEAPYEQYCRGMDMDVVLDKIANLYLMSREPDEAIRNVVENFQDPDFIREHVVVAVVNAEKNEKLLADTPHKMKEDLAIIYKIYLGTTGDSVGTILVKQEHMDTWGISLDELHECAMRNSKNLMPVKVEDMSTLLASMGFPVMAPAADEKDMMYVISNEQRINGAAGFLYSDCLEKLSQKLGTDLYIIPSSIHELLAVSTKSINAMELAKIIKEVNQTQVAEEEQLSDHVYMYEAETKTFSLVDTQAREQEHSEDAKEQNTEAETQESSRPRHHR
ncbi:MAG: DUF5688 family protein [Lachnospiraceae bacterium]|nr:DUF5688 family protein [Lachnospiraceae bacterium]